MTRKMLSLNHHKYIFKSPSMSSKNKNKKKNKIIKTTTKKMEFHFFSFCSYTNTLSVIYFFLSLSQCVVCLCECVFLNSILSWKRFPYLLYVCVFFSLFTFLIIGILLGKFSESCSKSKIQCMFTWSEDFWKTGYWQLGTAKK